MKKIFILLLMTIFAINLSAQEIEFIDPSYRIYLGPKAGLNFATMSGLSEELGLNPKSGLGYHGGLAAGIHFGRRTQESNGGTGLFGIQLEAMYSQRTIKTDIEDLKLSYIEIPILAQYYVMPELSIEVGPTIALAMSTSPDEMKYHRESGSMLEDITIKTGDLKGTDVMLTLGVGYKHKSGFTASARYNLGMSKLAGNFEGKVSTIAVSVGWLFNLIK